MDNLDTLSKYLLDYIAEGDDRKDSKFKEMSI